MPKSLPSRTVPQLRLKLKRANERLDALNRQLVRFSNRHPAIIATQLDPKTGWHTSYVRKIELPPASVALSVGESLYHGRSVLDHLVWALAKANGQKPGKQHEFPILTRVGGRREKEWNKTAFLRTSGAGKLIGVDPAAIALIESLQPYNRRDKATYYLTVLHETAREDRHHALPTSRVLMGAPEGFSTRLAVPTGVAIVDEDVLFKPGDRLKNGTKLIRFRLSKWGREPKVGVESDIPAPIAFGKAAVTLDGLCDINRRLADLLGLFDEFL